MPIEDDDTLFPSDHRAVAGQLLDRCREATLKVAVAESCTGGMLGALLTSIAGSSAVFDCGFVTYSNTAKTAVLDVPAEILAQHGAVSEATARAMASGALKRSMVDIAVAITGIAGPDGGSRTRPVGLVHFAAAGQTIPMIVRHRVFPGSRDAVRLASCLEACQLLIELLTRKAAEVG